MTIHLIAPKDKTKWSPIWHRCYNIWNLSPYKIKLWHDEDIDTLLRENDKEFFNKLQGLDKIYKWDYARILILEKFGGAYFDMDVEITSDFIKNLNPNQTYISGGSPFQDILTNWIVISPKSYCWSNFLERGKQLLLSNYDECKKNKSLVITTFGPAALSRFFTIQGFQDIQILSYWHFSDINSNLSFSKHYFTNSWH